MTASFRDRMKPITFFLVAQLLLLGGGAFHKLTATNAPDSEEWTQYDSFTALNNWFEREPERQKDPAIWPEWYNSPVANNRCIKYLTIFIGSNYRLRYPNDIFQLHACLMRLYRPEDVPSAFGEVDQETRKTMMQLAQDSSLKHIHMGTALNKHDRSNESFKCIKSAMKQIALMNAKNRCTFFEPIYGAHDACLPKLSDEAKKDTYIELINDAIQNHGQLCMDEIIKKLNVEGELLYKDERSLIHGIKHKLGRESSVVEQSINSHLAKSLMKVLQVVSGMSKTSSVDLNNIDLITDSLARKDSDFMDKFSRNLEVYANERIEGLNGKNVKAANEKYEQLIKDLCRPFRRLDEKDPSKYSGRWNFETYIKMLEDIVHLKNLFHIDLTQALRRLKEDRPYAFPIYLAVINCRSMKTTRLEKIAQNQFYTVTRPITDYHEQIYHSVINRL